MQTLATQIPSLEKLTQDIELAAEKKVKYAENMKVFDVDIPLICAYLHYWWNSGPEAATQPELVHDKLLSWKKCIIFVNFYLQKTNHGSSFGECEPRLHRHAEDGAEYDRQWRESMDGSFAKYVENKNKIKTKRLFISICETFQSARHKSSNT